jgi:translation initiation factor IF-2
LVGFGVGVLPTAKAILENSGIEFIQSDIIYHITERIEKIVTGMLDPKEVEIAL